MNFNLNGLSIILRAISQFVPVKGKNIKVFSSTEREKQTKRLAVSETHKGRQYV